MFKRYFIVLLLALTCMPAASLAAYADMIVTPNNDFYTRHSGECIHVGRGFYANGPGGYVSVKEAPDAKKETARIENGEIIHIQFSYDHNGQTWGAALLDKPDGWIPMEQLLLVYDHISFEEDHREEFYTYSGNLNAPGDIVFWTWPGSGVVACVLEAENRNPELEENWLAVDYAYLDSAGREWGIFSYVYARRNCWACLSDPASVDIPAFNPAPQPYFRPAEGDTTAAPASGGPSTPLLIIILVAALAAVTALLIRIFWKPGRGA
jgi:hypothetical protein